MDDDVKVYNIKGFYQSFKYFNKEAFKAMLTIPRHNEIPLKTDVAIHIRRTDYTKKNFHKLLSIDYYYNSLNTLSSKLKISKIYIFSDDINWCKQNFIHNTSIEFVTLEDEIEEFCFMMTFENIIMANSTFSWWAAYLSEGSNIYTPKHWFIDGCNLNTMDLRPNYWNVIDDDLIVEKTFRGDKFNVISLGSACCMVQNIHDNLYSQLGPLYRQPDNATNFFDWIITDFKSIAYVFTNLKYRDDSFLNAEQFTINDNKATSSALVGGWSSVYRKIEHVDQTMMFLHDVQKKMNEIPLDFFDKYKIRFERLYKKILEHDTLHLMHCFDFQWLKPYFPNVEELDVIFEACKTINPHCKVILNLLVHPDYDNNENKEIFNNYEKIENVRVFYLKHKGFHADWKANNLTFDELLHQ